jgi:hypothetical protein
VKVESRRQIRRVEFLGLPGAGKSTLCREILAVLGTDDKVFSCEQALDFCLRKRSKAGLPGKIVKTFPASFWKPLVGFDASIPEFHQFAVAHPALLQQVFSILTDPEIKQDWQSCILYVFVQLAVANVLFKNELPEDFRVFIEEGFVQGALTAFGYLPDTSDSKVLEISRYLEHCPLPDLVIYIDTPADVCLARLQNRSELPLILSGTEPLRRLEYVQQCLRDVVGELMTRNVAVWEATGDNKDGSFASPRQLAEKWLSENWFVA